VPVAAAGMARGSELSGNITELGEAPQARSRALLASAADQ
jgi:hypothetical protein